ncbi:hypothetical protein C4D60_Mb00t19730 [Musa balbisiana]|uniref:Uncharacterized protein n=1 Tax=Musa balbisiana TaxID=52838 RepID=A0A4S8I420_MUSBA|nr:hypothetical protein C4D60_Mb00t19730 [Musa balbisiana]
MQLYLFVLGSESDPEHRQWRICSPKTAKNNPAPMSWADVSSSATGVLPLHYITHLRLCTYDDDREHQTGNSVQFIG